MEQTLVIIKPDGVKRQLIGQIITRFEQKNLKLVQMKMGTMSPDLARKHYVDIQEQPFFEEVITFMTSGPVVYLVLEGNEVINVIRQMIGQTNALKANPGTIRGDFGAAKGENIVHASDSLEHAQSEIALFFD